MKTILVTAALTLVFIVALVFVEQKRLESMNRMNFEYQNAFESSFTDLDDGDEFIEELEETIDITIEGEVKNPGTYTVDNGTILYTVIEKAGGLTDLADSSAIKSDYSLTKTMTIYVPKSNNNNKISINTADASTLDLLPGIGSVLAERIIAYREENGEFRLLEDVMNVEGIGSSLYNKIKDYITL